MVGNGNCSSLILNESMTQPNVVAGGSRQLQIAFGPMPIASQSAGGPRATGTRISAAAGKQSLFDLLRIQFPHLVACVVCGFVAIGCSTNSSKADEGGVSF
jgi:hypothetical protein